MTNTTSPNALLNQWAQSLTPQQLQYLQSQGPWSSLGGLNFTTTDGGYADEGGWHPGPSGSSTGIAGYVPGTIAGDAGGWENLYNPDGSFNKQYLSPGATSLDKGMELLDEALLAYTLGGAATGATGAGALPGIAGAAPAGGTIGAEGLGGGFAAGGGGLSGAGAYVPWEQGFVGSDAGLGTGTVAGAGTGSTVPGVFNAAADSQAANDALGLTIADTSSLGAPMSVINPATGLPETVPTGVLPSGGSAGGGTPTGTTPPGATPGSTGLPTGLPTGLGGLGGLLGPVLGGLAGSQPQTTTKKSDIPDWLKPYVTGSGGILDQTQALLKQQMAPGYLAGYDTMRGVGQNMMNAQVPGDMFSRFFPNASAGMYQPFGAGAGMTPPASMGAPQIGGGMGGVGGGGGGGMGGGAGGGLPMSGGPAPTMGGMGRSVSPSSAQMQAPGSPPPNLPTSSGTGNPYFNTPGVFARSANSADSLNYMSPQDYALGMGAPSTLKGQDVNYTYAQPDPSWNQNGTYTGLGLNSSIYGATNGLNGGAATANSGFTPNNLNSYAPGIPGHFALNSGIVGMDPSLNSSLFGPNGSDIATWAGGGAQPGQGTPRSIGAGYTMQNGQIVADPHSLGYSTNASGQLAPITRAYSQQQMQQIRQLNSMGIRGHNASVSVGAPGIRI